MKVERIALHSFAPILLGPGSMVVDLGGNRGEFSTKIIDRFGCCVLAVEPVPALYEAFPKRDRLTVVHAAATGAPGEVQINVNPSQCASIHLVEPGAVAATVRAVSLPQLLSDHDISSVDLLKVDIEGAELELFAATPDAVLLSCRQTTMEFHELPDIDSSAQNDAIVDRLAGLGFQIFRSNDMTDVLFLHSDVKMSGAEYRARLIHYVWVRNVIRWLRLGLGRRARVVADRLERAA
jgi:FkbM family methyltransferase